MGEYARVVGGGGGGRGGGSGDISGDIMAALSDAVDQVASLPPEALIAIAVALLVLGVLFLRR